MSTLLVIGGSGFFGKSILDAYSRGLLRPWGISRVIAMSRNAHELSKQVPHLITERVELLSADISIVNSLPTADYVIHAAASTDVRGYISKPEQEKKNIQAGTYNYCDLAKLAHPKSKIVYVSSGAVYGVQPKTLNAITESYRPDTLVGMDPGKIDYAIAKNHAESAIKTLAAEGLNLSIARCFAFVGMWLPRDQHFAIGNFIDDGINGRPIKVKAQHKVYRSYMYADDLVEWLMTIAENSNPLCPVYNVGSDQEVLLGDLAQKISKLFSVEADVAAILETKIDRYIPSIEKAKTELGLYLKYDLMSSIYATLKGVSL
ncbi:MAG TPA: NAD(P)-dependent oxidoreductase [Methylophilaceae bacterium]|jgi:dTDP-glucose 4,6-dehydratase